MSRLSVVSIGPIVSAATIAGLTWSLTALAAQPDAESVLKSKGLISHRHFWINRHEQALRAKLEELVRLERQCQEAQKQVLAIVERNETVRAQLATAHKKAHGLKKLADASQPGSPIRKAHDDALKQQRDLIKDLTPRYVEPTKFAALPATKAAVLRLTGELSAAWTAVDESKRLLQKMDRNYSELAQDTAVVAALEQLGPDARLGPTDSIKNDRKRIASVETALVSMHVPVYRESECYRVSVIVNERVPATFTLLESTEPTIITASLAQAAEINVDDMIAAGEHYTKDGRKLMLRKGAVSRLRIGTLVLEDLQVSVLPPEGEDLGAQIGLTTLQSASPKLQPHLLRLELTPAKQGE